MKRNPVDDLRACVEMHRGCVDNPVLLVANEELAEIAKTICKENNLPVKLEVVKSNWKKKPRRQ